MKTWMIPAALLLAACHGNASKSTIGAEVDAGADTGGTPGDGASSSLDGGPAATGVTFTNLSTTDSLAWVAVRDGDGPWLTVDGKNGVYNLPVASPRYAVAFVCDPGKYAFGELIETTVAELPQLTTDCGPFTPTMLDNHLKVAVQGLAPGVEVHVSALDGFGAEGTERSFDLVLWPGTYDLVGLARNGMQPVQVAFTRGVRVPGDPAATLDFTVEHKIVEQPLTVMGADDVPEVWVDLTTSRGGSAGLKATPDKYYSLAGKDLAAGDVQRMTVSENLVGPSVEGERGVALGLGEPQPLVVSLPPPFLSPKVTPIAGAPYFRPHLTFTPYAGATLYQYDVWQVESGSAPTKPKSWLVILSANALAGAQSYDFPDFSDARGFDQTWAFQPSDPAFCDVQVAVSSRDFARTINKDPASRGSKLSYARVRLPLH